MVGEPQSPGSLLPVTAKWRDAVEARLRDLGWTRARLAQTIGVDPSTITNILRLKHPTSKWVSPICGVLELDPPVVALDVDTARWLEVGKRLRETDETRFLRELERWERVASILESSGDADDD